MTAADAAATIRPLDGYHHATILCRDAVANVRFYRDLLRLRLVKQTVNFDVPQSYHLYYGDALGTPGTLLTFFPWPRMRDGIEGWGGTDHLALSVPSAPALAYWRGELERADVEVEGPLDHDGHPTLRFRDPDGLRLELVAPASDLDEVPDGAPALYSDNFAIGALQHTQVLVTDLPAAQHFYRDILGFDPLPENTDEGEPADTPVVEQRLLTASQHTELPLSDMRITLTLIDRDARPRAHDGVGRTHHLAFGVTDEAQLLAWRDRLEGAGVVVTEVRDRFYFQSIYFNDPDGHLLEIATSDIGFTRDEAASALGQRLSLPPWLKERRAELVARLPELPAPPANDGPRW